MLLDELAATTDVARTLVWILCIMHICQFEFGEITNIYEIKLENDPCRGTANGRILKNRPPQSFRWVIQIMGHTDGGNNYGKN